MGLHVSCQHRRKLSALVGASDRLQTVFHVSGVSSAHNLRLDTQEAEAALSGGRLGPRPRGFAMTDSIARRVITAATLLAAPLVVLIFFFVADVRVRAFSVFIALVAIGLAWWLAESLARRINALRAFVDTMLDQTGARPALAQGDDELGELTRSLARGAENRRTGQSPQHGIDAPRSRAGQHDGSSAGRGCAAERHVLQSLVSTGGRRS